MVGFHHPANRKLLEYLGAKARAADPPREREEDPAAVADPYYTLGTHPEIVERLWDELGGQLPQKCRWVLYRNPVLVHPRTGVVFGFAGGSLTYALRLPPPAHAAAIRAGAATVHDYPAYPELGVAASTFDLAGFGPEWVFGRWLKGEEDWCCAAYQYAAAQE